MGQGVHTVALQVAVQELGHRPDAHRGDRRHHPRARLRPDHRLPRHADGKSPCPAAWTVAYCWPRQHGEGNPAHQLQPAKPARQLLEDVGPHQPDETHARELTQQPAQRVDCVARAEHRLNRAGDHAAAIRDVARGPQAPVERRHAAPRLQRIAGRHEQPDLIEPQSFACEIDDVAMALMRRIERAAEQADAHSPSVTEPWDWLMPGRRVQGRTCPVPITK